MIQIMLLSTRNTYCGQNKSQVDTNTNFDTFTHEETFVVQQKNSPLMHVDEVSKSIGDQGRVKILVKSFTGQVTQWWETQAPRL
jgi:hypothetical protein